MSTDKRTLFKMRVPLRTTYLSKIRLHAIRLRINHQTMRVVESL